MPLIDYYQQIYQTVEICRKRCWGPMHSFWFDRALTEVYSDACLQLRYQEHLRTSSCCHNRIHFSDSYYFSNHHFDSCYHRHLCSRAESFLARITRLTVTFRLGSLSCQQLLMHDSLDLSTYSD